ncbi:AzlC family ABC transporter permease [soil metagenome]
MLTIESARRRGMVDTLPLLAPLIPFAMVLGLAISESSITDMIGWLGSSVIFGGAAQLTVVTLTGAGAGLLAVIAAGWVIQARHLMYSAALAPTFGRQPRWFRLVGPYFLVDQVFALVVMRADSDPAAFRRYYLSTAVTFWSVWQVAVALGLLVGPVVPDAWSLGLAVPLLFLGLLIGAVDGSPAMVAALAAAGVTWATFGLPNRAGLLVGAVAGVLAGFLAERSRT